MLFHDFGKPYVKETDEAGRDHFKIHNLKSKELAVNIMHRLKLDNDTIGKVSRLVEWHDYRPEATKKSVRKAVNRIGEELFPMYLEVREADCLAQSEYKREEKLLHLEKVKACYAEILENQDCMSLKNLAVTGRDLIAAGYQPGKQIGEMLSQLLEHVLEYPEDNKKEILLSKLVP
jgi:tRNA nucleotidyltransferase (CCA-adding enzyme)